MNVNSVQAQRIGTIHGIVFTIQVEVVATALIGRKWIDLSEPANGRVVIPGALVVLQQVRIELFARIQNRRGGRVVSVSREIQRLAVSIVSEPCFNASVRGAEQSRRTMSVRQEVRDGAVPLLRDRCGAERV